MSFVIVWLCHIEVNFLVGSILEERGIGNWCVIQHSVGREGDPCRLDFGYGN